MESIALALGFVCVGAVLGIKWDSVIYRAGFILERRFGKIFWEAA